MRAIRLGVLYFAAVFAVGFALGTIRTLILVPRLGELGAVAVELPVILSAAWIICGWLLRGPKLTLSQAAGTGAVAFALLMLVEAALSMVFSDRTITEHLALYTDPAHLLGLAGQIAFASFPLIRPAPGTVRFVAPVPKFAQKQRTRATPGIRLIRK